MKRQIQIQWVELGKSVTATLVEDKNQGICNLLWDRLPYCSIQTHALVSGEHLYHIAPIVDLVTTAADYKEDRTKSPDGTVFLSQLQHMAIKYGTLSEYLPAAPVAYVNQEDVPLLKAIGAECWDSIYRNKQPIEVRVTRKSAPAQANDAMVFPDFGHIASAAGQRLLDEIETEMRNTWLLPPREIVDIHQGRIASGAGSRGQWLSTLVFVNGETRPLGYCGLGGLMQISRHPEISLETLQLITRNFIKVPAEFLGYCGLDHLWNFVQRTIAVLPELQSKDEYFSLVSALALYTNQLNAWNLHFYPWDLAEGKYLTGEVSVRAAA
jgi:hypothetical protein